MELAKLLRCVCRAKEHPTYASNGAKTMDLLSAYGYEAASFVALSSIAARTRTGWSLAATLPYNYLCAYSTSRAVMAYQRKPALSGLNFELHRFVGSLCVLYAISAWYKLVVLGGKALPEEWQALDHIFRWGAALSTFWNEISGILLLPHVNRMTPLLLRQTFTVGTSMGLATFLLLVVMQLRAWYPEGNALISFASVVTIVWNLIAVIMGVLTAQILSREKVMDPAEREQYEETLVKKEAPNTVSAFFYDVFVNPGAFNRALKTKDGFEVIPGASKPVAQAIVLSTLTLPGIVMGIIALNLGLNDAIPMFGPGVLHNETGIRYTLACLEMVAYCVIPANLLDLTLVLRKRMETNRAVVEVPSSLLWSLFAPALLALAVLQTDDCSNFIAMLRAIMWPVLGSV